MKVTLACIVFIALYFAKNHFEIIIIIVKASGDDMAINLYENITLENDRIRLVPMQLSHAAELQSINHDSIWTYMLFQATTEEAMSEWIQSAIELRNQLKSIPFVVVLKATGEVVGATRIQHIDYERQSC